MMQIAGHEITKEEYRALAYILVGPDAWIEDAAKQRKGAEAIAHKIKRALLLVAGVSEEEYMTRVERDALAEAEMQPTAEQLALRRELVHAGMEADLAAAKLAKLRLAQAEIERWIAELSEVRP